MSNPTISLKQAALLVALALFVGAIFIQEPGLGDELTYWSMAFELHDEGGSAWDKNSFHDLRWPVWGLCWALQGVLGPGLPSFYGCPWIYAAIGALVAFAFGRKLGPPGLAWTAAIAFLFHPLLDLVIHRPMPDMSEGVIGGCAVLCWLAVMRANGPGVAWVFSALTGLSIAVAHSNRLTGVFIIPVLLVCTLLFFRRRFHWLLACGLFAALFVGIECLIYQRITGDFLHSLHANLSARGRKGTESIALWYLPFRFLDSIWKGNHIAPVYCLLAVFGGWAAWRKGGVVGRVIVTWLAVLYLEYSCALQSVSPPRPLIRDAERFLCALALPMALLVAFGAAEIWTWLRIFAPTERPTAWLARRPWVGAIGAVLLLIAVTSRERFNLGYVPEFRARLEQTPPGSKVFTHRLFRAISFLVNAPAAKKLEWSSESRIMHVKPSLELVSARSDHFWYARKLVWLTTRKNLENKRIPEPLPLGSYLANPGATWYLQDVINKGDTPDFVFYRRRTPADPPPVVLGPESPELKTLFPAIPFEWDKKTGKTTSQLTWAIPETLRGRCVQIQVTGFAHEVEALNATLLFSDGKRELAEYVLKPYFHPVSFQDFFAFDIPKEASTCEIRLRFNKSTKHLKIENVVVTHEQ